MSLVDTEAGVRATGLGAAEVAERIAAGLVNRPARDPRRTLGQIVAANVLTPVNGIMLVLFAAIAAAGHWKDGLFVGVVLSNSVVGIVQELSARRELAKLQVVSDPRARVIHDGRSMEIDADAVVTDDLVEVSAGQQIVVDGTVTASAGLSIDESLLTGEARPVAKGIGAGVLSGSFVAAGSGRFQATRVGADSYAGALTTEARRFSLAGSQLRASINRVIRWLLIVIPFAAVSLWLSLIDSQDRWQDAMQGTVAAAVSMVPDGLVLLTSVSFVAGVLTLSRHRALAKQLATVESLARVDVLCLDKTGTITSGDISFAEAEPLGDRRETDVMVALAAFARADQAPNATMSAIAAGVGAPPDWPVLSFEPFSSATKWSAASFDGHGVYVVGAPDVLLDDDDPLLERIARRSATGARIVMLAHAHDAVAAARALPSGLEPAAIVVLHDEIRPDAADTVDYFTAQGVTLKIISGDNPSTVAAVAARAHVPMTKPGIDARTLPASGAALGYALDSGTVFGRVTPTQKQAMVTALQERGHVVAMTGDGVNDVLALKQADLGVAMGSGSSAARAVADLVLTDNAFATLPTVVDEGRKVINNVERVSNLFLTKTVYAVLLTLIVALAGIPFPLLPRQLTLIGTFSIGIPGFFLALSPDVHRVRAGFLRRVLTFSIPSGLVAGAAAMGVYQIARAANSTTLQEARTVTTVALLGIGLSVLVVSSRPLRPWKLGLAATMAAAYAAICSIGFLRRYFELHLGADTTVWAATAILVGMAGALIAVVPRFVNGLQDSGS